MRHRLGPTQSPCSRQTTLKPASARLQATAAPDAPAPTIRTSGSSQCGSDIIRDRLRQIVLASLVVVAQCIEAGGHVRGTIGMLGSPDEVLDAVDVPVLALAIHRVNRPSCEVNQRISPSEQWQ